MHQKHLRKAVLFWTSEKVDCMFWGNRLCKHADLCLKNSRLEIAGRLLLAADRVKHGQTSGVNYRGHLIARAASVIFLGTEGPVSGCKY